MKYRKIIYSLLIPVVLLSTSNYSNAQLFSPGRNWAGLTQYLKIGTNQDSIFVFFSYPSAPKKGALKARFSDGSLSDFKWYKYNDAITNPANRFQLFYSQNSVLESNPSNLERGGYKVIVTRISDSVTEKDSCWVMIDDVVITRIDIDNNCSSLFLDTKLQPSRYDIVYDYFTYFDLSKSNQPEINKLGSDYFKNLTWHASNSQIPIPPNASLSLVLENPAPLYNSKYDIRIVNPFGRVLTYETLMLTAKAPKADFIVYVDSDGTWNDGGTEPGGEAPLKLKFESKSINTDSIYWRIKNDNKLFLIGGDSIVWRDSALFTDRIEAYPIPEKMVPGKYPIEHIALKMNSGCRDTMTIFAVVDSSAIKPDAIPNVFSPNGDGVNDFFVFKEPKTNISSIKTFRICIISRGGQLIYDYKGDPKIWEGWNGKINGNRGDAPDGVYYYTIEAVGWDNRIFKRGKYKGFLYVLRGK